MNVKEYKKKCKGLNLPIQPDRTFKGKGWIDWYDFFGKPKPISKRTTKILTNLAISPILLEDDAPLQVIYMVASQIDKKLAKEIEELLNTTSCEDRLEWIKEQLKNLKADTTSTSMTTTMTTTDELSAMESVMDVLGDSMDELSEDVAIDINNILKNHHHNAINRELIAEYDD